jgi:hypothetical protein
MYTFERWTRLRAGGPFAQLTTSSPLRIGARCAAASSPRSRSTCSSRPKETRAAGGTRTPPAFAQLARRVGCRRSTSGAHRSPGPRADSRGSSEGASGTDWQNTPTRLRSGPSLQGCLYPGLSEAPEPRGTSLVGSGVARGDHAQAGRSLLNYRSVKSIDWLSSGQYARATGQLTGTDDFRAAVASEALATGHRRRGKRALRPGAGTFP